MKREQMVLIIAECLVEPHSDSAETEADYILKRLEKLGMGPPCLDHDKCQVLHQIYIDPHFNIWDEDFEANPKLVEALKKRLGRKKK